LPSGWRNNPSRPQISRLAGADGEVFEVEYRFDRDGRLVHPPATVLHEATPERVEMSVDGVRRVYRVSPDAVGTERGTIAIREQPRFADVAAEDAPGTLTAPMPGTVVRISAATGDHVEAGQVLLTLEAMKMEFEVVAPFEGELTSLPVEIGKQVDGGVLLAVIEAP
ncbi:MAG: biotin/lipoyl-binding protein, partial [Thermoleophilia bacterium]|nr:biotin/lipoyl-binding protein [Thermoleophilia bacterium]